MDYAKLSSEDLYEMCLRGDESAWWYVYCYVLAIAKSPRWRLSDTPNDMAQSIVCHLLDRGLESVRQPEAFRSFVRRVAVNFLLDCVKGRKPVFETIDDTNGEKWRHRKLSTEDPSPEELLLSDALAQAFRNALQRISGKCREVLEAYLEYKAGKHENYRAFAHALGKTIGTLSSQIKRCLDELREAKEIRAWLEP